MKLAAICSILVLCVALGAGFPTEEKSALQEFVELEVKLLQFVRDHKAELKQWFVQLLNHDTQEGVGTMSYLNCGICSVLWPFLKLYHFFGLDPALGIGLVVLFCENTDISPHPDICEPIITAYADTMFYMVENKPELVKDDFCGIIAGSGCTNVSSELIDWTIRIDSNKPPIEEKPIIPNDIELKKIIRFSDIHLDLDYTEGTNGDCGLPICCRPQFGNDSLDLAGPYGHLNCGLPVKGLEALLQHARDNHGDASYIFLTGDYIHNGIWLVSAEVNERHIRAVMEKVKEYFPDTPIYPVIGNHEPDPINMFPPKETWDTFNMTWMYEAMAEQFYIPDDQMKLFKEYGYYQVDPEDGLRFIVLNTNLCYDNNFWLPYDPIDPTDQLQWFADAMLQAEKDGVLVYLLTHINPLAGSCWDVWGDKYLAIIDRFENIIRGQFAGHSHSESINLFFHEDTDRPIGSIFIGPSAVPSEMNAGYKVFLADGVRSDATWELVHHETHCIDLAATYETSSPVFITTVDSTEMYGLKDLRPESLKNFVERMARDADLFSAYRNGQYKGLWQNPCVTPDCRASTLCGIVKSEKFCERLRTLVNSPPDDDDDDDNAAATILPAWNFFMILGTFYLALRN